MKVNTDFNIGEAVYIINDEDQYMYFIVSIRILPNACVVYELKSLDERMECYEFELSKHKQIII